MSQSFKLKFDQLRENNPTTREAGAEQSSEVQDESYFAESNVRNVSFAWPDGRKVFLNYAYLISCEYLPEENSLTLCWTTHTVILKGYGLHLLFEELMQHLPRQIACTDPRYNATADKEQAVVNEIYVVKNG